MKYKKSFLAIMLLILILGQGGSALAVGETNPDVKLEDLERHYEEEMNSKEVVVKAQIIEIPYDDTGEERPDIPKESDIRYQHLKVKITTGTHMGEVYTVRNTIEFINPYNLIFKKGERVLLYMLEDEAGKVNSLRIFERPREEPIYYITGLFFLGIIVIGGMKGIKSVITLIFTVVAILFVMLPLLLRGWNPILVAVGISAITAAFTLIVVSGRNRKTYTAILGTVIGVAAAGIVALLFGHWARLTGMGTEEAQMLAYIPQNRHIDYKGLLFAGIIIGALGAVMDVAMSIAASMAEIEFINPKITNKDLFKSGMNVGRDIMGSMTNTLILAYVGSSIQILLLFLSFNVSPYAIINMDDMASEIVRAMAGSIGLVLAIPITAVVYIYTRKKEKNKK